MLDREAWSRAAADPIVTERLRLTPLEVDDAESMAAVLDDVRLHTFIGGRPLAPAELRDRYRRLVDGSPDPNEMWLNWIVRLDADAQPVGTVQATLTAWDGPTTAHIAWVVGVEWQGRGFASEAARALAGWLRGHGAGAIVAHIHPEHRASELVARRAGLEPTDDFSDDERVWRSPPQPS